MKTRILTGIILALVVIPFLLIGGYPYQLFIILLSSLGLWEFMKVKGHYPFIVELISFIYLFLIILFNMFDVVFNLNEKILLSLFILLIIPSLIYQKSNKYTISDAFYLLSGVLFLGIAFSLLIVIRNISLYSLIYLFVITVSTDTFAYLIGRFFGKHKLIPSISPKKTWEGSIGGTIFGVLLGTIFYIIMINQNINLFYILSISLILSIAGQIGDLVFSAIKRYYNVKDYSNLMPGHGGVLDRFDSLIFVSIVYALIFLTI